MNMSNITFKIPRLGTFAFKKCSEKNTFTIKYSEDDQYTANMFRKY